ncbi:hypothetical protein PsorP6_014250 [Peronosclerospora sorghi]|uniref:Uncharacterized protein n=1 Tax=Peronosclerospora sorghi TaxID=230839 RepID=A0ACC0VJM0_9STRA|nr:hypothetical protein PsorP6_014250 [Peronosclerospora sorghi]
MLPFLNNLQASPRHSTPPIMPDSYMLFGSVLAMLATAVLFLRDAKPKQDKFTQEMLRIGQQMKLYKEAANPAVRTGTNVPSSCPSVQDEHRACFPGGRLTILFGSQTGTAEGFANVLKHEGRHAGFQADVLDLEMYDAATKLHDERLVICVLATYGDGDPTDNAVAFVKFLNDRDRVLGERALATVRYTVFGLGNKQYEHYNAVGRAVDALLAKHGAQRVFPYGEGDDDACLHEDFDDWKAGLWPALQKAFVRTHDTRMGATVAAAPAYEYELVAIQASDVATRTPAAHEIKMKASTKHFFTATSAKVVVNKELRRSRDDGSTRHIELELRGTDVTYETADTLAVLPENDPTLVDRLARFMHYSLDQWVVLQAVNNTQLVEVPFPSPCTIRDILTRYLAITSAPRKGALTHLATCASDPVERATLTRLASKNGRDEYQAWILDAERSFVDVLAHFRSVHVSVQALLHLVPFLQPRYYTISSSRLVTPQRVHATVRVIARTKHDGRVFQGVCSNYLGRLQPLTALTKDKQDKTTRPWPRARIFVRASTFRLPKDPRTPIILIGPGTGIAPMRAFLHERARLHDDGVDVGPSILYFGCRHRDDDFLYQDELEAFHASGVLTQLHVAFSRDMDDRVYVQDLLQQHAAVTWDLVHTQHASIYVCGGTSMGNDVHKVLQDIVASCGRMTTDEAHATLTKLRDEQRYVQELWA